MNCLQNAKSLIRGFCGPIKDEDKDLRSEDKDKDL